MAAENQTGKKKNWLFTIVPVAGDSPREWVRKIIFWVALIVFVVAAYYLLNELVFMPGRTQQSIDTTRELFTEEPPANPEEPDDTVYPEGIQESFRRLYRANPDVRGWLTFATEGEDLFNGAIDNPVVQCADNDYYLNHNFFGEEDKAGSLFFDYRNDLSNGAVNRNLIIYGHNLNTGLMFTNLNRLATGKVANAKRLTTMTLETLYDKAVYKVFAVMTVNVKEAEGPVFNYLRTQFADEEDFLRFVSEIRRRSLYDFGDVEVEEGDQLLILSTCSNRRDTYINDGRTVVVARKVRPGESETVDTGKTVKNADVLMPKIWYVSLKKPLPEEYQ